MILRIKEFLSSPEHTMEIRGELKDQNSSYDISDLDLIFPITYSGNIFKLDKDLLLDLCINYKYNTQCDRCLTPMVEEVSSCFKAYYTQDVESKEDEATIEYFPLTEEGIFLDDLIISQVITSKPLKELCKDDCKGLCPECGKNLNEGPCSCKEELDVDPRFEKLLNLFNDEEV